MSRTAVLAWGTFGLSLGAMVAALVVWAAATGESLTPDIVLYPAAYIAFGAVGALIASRHPTNRIGRLALVTGAIGAFVGLCDSFARMAQPVPGQELAAWVATWAFPVTLAPPLMLVLLFPTGRLASRRWAIVAGLILVGSGLIAIGNAFTPRMVDYPGLRNPFGIDGFQGSVLESGGVGWFPLLGGAIAAAVGLVPRLRRARGVERQQLKWITFAAAVQGLAWVVLALDLRGTAGDVAGYAVFGSLLLIPVATGIAILRYRLYDIDLVIRRTLVYGALVAVLGTCYVVLVLGLQMVMSGLTGSETLPVALSTLAIAALFGPARARVRAMVDRRFYRSRYDAQRTLAQYGGQMRDQVDLDSVGRTLAATAAAAVRPASIGLWIRGS